MPDNPFDRTVINPREKPLSEDVNRYLSQMDRALRYFARSMFASSSGVPTSGFLQNGLNAVEDSPQAMSVILKAGLGFQDLPADVPTSIDGVVGLDDLESYKPLPLLADLVVSIPTAPTAPNTRIDILEVRADRLKTDSQSRKVFNNATEVFDATPVDKTLEFLLDGTKFGSVASPAASTAAISLKTGVEGTPGAVPATTSGYIKVAEIFVDSDVVVIADADVTDTRPLLTDVVGERVLVLSALSGYFEGVSGSFGTDGTATAEAVSDTFFMAIPLLIGDQIKSVRYSVDAAGVNTKDFQLKYVDLTTNNATPIINETSTASGVIDGSLDDVNHTITANQVILFELSFGDIDDRFGGIQVTYDHPVA